MSLTLTRNVGEAVILQAVDVTYRLTVLTCGAGRVRFSAVNLVTDQQVIRAIERGGSKWNVFGDVWLDVSATRGRQARLVFDAPREVVILRQELQAFAPDIRELRRLLHEEQEVGRVTRLDGKPKALGLPYSSKPVTGRGSCGPKPIWNLPKRS